MNNIVSIQQAFRSQQAEILIAEIKAQRNRIGKQAIVADKLHIHHTLISKYETGKAPPTAHYLKALAECAKLSNGEVDYWLGLAGYMPTTQMPDLDQIKSKLELYCQDIERSVFPVAIVDYRLGFWAMNAAVHNVNGFGEDVARQILSSGRGNMLEMGLDERFACETTQQPDSARQATFALFESININRRHENFYINFEEIMRKKLRASSKAFTIFRKYWNSSVEMSRILRISLTTGQEGKVVSHREQVEFVRDLPQFAVVRFVPQTNALAEALQKRSATIQPVLKLWDVMLNVEVLIREYNIENLIEPD